MEDPSFPFLKHLTTQLRKTEHTNWRGLYGNLHNTKVINKHLLSPCYIHSAHVICSSANGSKGNQLSLGVQRVQELYEKTESQERRAQSSYQNLQIAEQFSPPTRESGRGEKAQEGGTVIWSPPVDMWFVGHLWRNPHQSPPIFEYIAGAFLNTEVSETDTKWEQGCQIDSDLNQRPSFPSIK